MISYLQTVTDDRLLHISNMFVTASDNDVTNNFPPLPSRAVLCASALDWHRLEANSRQGMYWRTILDHQKMKDPRAK